MSQALHFIIIFLNLDLFSFLQSGFSSLATFHLPPAPGCQTSRLQPLGSREKTPQTLVPDTSCPRVWRQPLASVLPSWGGVRRGGPWSCLLMVQGIPEQQHRLMTVVASSTYQS